MESSRPLPRPAFAALAVLAFFSILIGSCAKRAPESLDAASPSRNSASFEDDGASPSHPATDARADRKLVYTVELSLEVDDASDAAARATELIDSTGGFVERMDSSHWRGQPHVSMTLRLPAERLDEVVDELRGLAERVQRESRRVEDVTARYVDLDARVRTLQRTEEELEALLGESRQRGAKADEVMAIYREITQIRADRESLEGTLRTLSRQVELATVELQLEPTASSLPLVGDPWSPGDTVHSAVGALLAGLRHLVDLLIFAVIVFLPILLVVALPIWLLVRWWRRKAR